MRLMSLSRRTTLRLLSTCEYSQAPISSNSHSHTNDPFSSPEEYHSYANNAAPESNAEIENDEAQADQAIEEDQDGQNIHASQDIANNEEMSMVNLDNVDDYLLSVARCKFSSSEIQRLSSISSLLTTPSTDITENEAEETIEREVENDFAVDNGLEHHDEPVDNNAEHPNELATNESATAPAELAAYDEMDVDEMDVDGSNYYNEPLNHTFVHNGELADNEYEQDDEPAADIQSDHDDEPAANHEYARENLCPTGKMFASTLSRSEHCPSPFSTKYATIDDDTSLEFIGGDNKYRTKLFTIFEEKGEEERAFSRAILKAAGPLPTFAPIDEMARLPSYSDDEYEEPTLKSPDISIESSNFDIKHTPEKAHPRPEPKAELQLIVSPTKLEPNKETEASQPPPMNTYNHFEFTFSFPKPAKTTTALTTSSSFTFNFAPIAPTTTNTTSADCVVKSIDDTSCEQEQEQTSAAIDNGNTTDISNTTSSPPDTDSDSDDYFLKQGGLDFSATPTNLPTVSMTLEESMQEAWETHLERSTENLDTNDECHRIYDRVRGIRLQQCTWALIDKPNIFGKCTGPLLMLTTPEGDIKYPQDMKYYEGASNWADDDDDDDEDDLSH